jgi:hypothetical protein
MRDFPNRQMKIFKTSVSLRRGFGGGDEKPSDGFLSIIYAKWQTVCPAKRFPFAQAQFFYLSTCLGKFRNLRFLRPKIDSQLQKPSFFSWPDHPSQRKVFIWVRKP